MTQEQLALFLAKLAEKNSWGKNEVRNLVLDILAGVIRK